jgi:hypothetical protein
MLLVRFGVRLGSSFAQLASKPGSKSDDRSMVVEKTSGTDTRRPAIKLASGTKSLMAMMRLFSLVGLGLDAPPLRALVLALPFNRPLVFGAGVESEVASRSAG